ncbi:MAG: DUF4221 family protein [Bacteroidales bacterium]|nr:DUF4221 family protein [Bacteroidales bacterium]
MKLSVFPLILVTIFFLFACNAESSYVTTGVNKEFVLKNTDQINFPLDSMTSDNIFIAQIYQNNQIEELVFYNEYNFSLYFYSTDKQKFLKKIQLNTKGPNALNYAPEAILVKNSDSIFIQTYEGVLLVNSKAEIKNKYPINRESPEIMAMVNSITSPMVVVGNHLFIRNFGPRPLAQLIKLNLKTKEYTTAQQYPEIYAMNNWFSLQKLDYFNFQPRYCFVEEQNKFVFVYPPLDSIYISNGQDFIAKIPLENPYFDHKIITPVRNEIGRASSLSTFNSGILYDTYRNVYYLITDLAVSEEKYKQAPLTMFDTPIVISVLNTDFDVISRIVLNEKLYKPNFAVVTRKGLMIQNAEQTNEDELSFSLFNLVKNED